MNDKELRCDLMPDEILWQEIYSLREKLKVATEILKYYEPELDEPRFMHDIGTEDFQLYLENNKAEAEAKQNVVYGKDVRRGDV